MSTDETYLESFIESIGTLPSEMKRNLIHMKSLDQAYNKIIQELRDCEEDYLVRAYEAISSLPVQSKEEPDKKKQKTGDGDGNEDNSDRKEEDTSKEGKDVDSDSDKDGGEKKNDESKPKSKDDSAQNSSDDDDEEDENDGDFWSDPKEGIPISVPISNFPEEGEDEDGADDDNKEDKDGNGKCKTKTILVVPTTEELRQKIHNSTSFAPSSSREELIRIATLRRDARQMTEEKLINARQTYTLVNDAIKRLDSDLEKFEAMLKTTGQYEKAISITGGPQPDDLAAIQVTPNSPDWILAKVITHDPRTGMYNLSDEDIESNKTFTLPENQVVILGGVDRLSRGDVIYGIYPDTTSFYQATVVQIPKKTPGKDPFVLVHFKDDGDENGITHEKPVLMKHIMRVPYGAIQ